MYLPAYLPAYISLSPPTHLSQGPKILYSSNPVLDLDTEDEENLFSYYISGRKKDLVCIIYIISQWLQLILFRETSQRVLVQNSGILMNLLMVMEYTVCFWVPFNICVNNLIQKHLVQFFPLSTGVFWGYFVDFNNPKYMFNWDHE